MRNFDKLLSEALFAPPELFGNNLKAEIEKLFEMWGKENDQNKQDQIADKIQELRTDDNREEWYEYVQDIQKRNGGNEKFKNAMKKKAARGDNLATWMLRHLISKAGGV